MQFLAGALEHHQDFLNDQLSISKTKDQRPPPVTRRLPRTRDYHQPVKELKIGKSNCYNKAKNGKKK